MTIDQTLIQRHGDELYDALAAGRTVPNLRDRVPGDTVAPLRSASDGGDSWGDLAAKSGRKAMGGIKNGWNRFADWTIDLGARADVPARVAALRLDEKAKAAAAKTAELS